MWTSLFRSRECVGLLRQAIVIADKVDDMIEFEDILGLDGDDQHTT